MNGHSIGQFIVCAGLLLVLSACGLDTVGSAATGAAVKQQEVQQGLSLKERATQQVQQATDATQQRHQQLEQVERR